MKKTNQMKNTTYILLLCLLAFFACTNETKVESITLNPTEITLNVGETSQIEMIISPISASIYNPTSWKSSNPNVAQVDNKGNVTAIYAGECIITGKTKYHEAYCKVTVVAPEKETYKVQELHLPIYHCLCAMLEEEFF